VAEEPGLRATLDQASHLLRGGLRRKWYTLALSLLLAFSVAGWKALSHHTYAPRFVLRVAEMEQDPGLSPRPRRDLKDYVREAVQTALIGLDQRERYIVENRLMADNEDEMSLAEIGRRLGVSRERARQLEARAKKKLKSKITELSRGNGWLDIHDAA